MCIQHKPSTRPTAHDLLSHDFICHSASNDPVEASGDAKTGSERMKDHPERMEPPTDPSSVLYGAPGTDSWLYRSTGGIPTKSIQESEDWSAWTNNDSSMQF